MNKQAAADPTRERRRLTVHMLWPESLKQRVTQAAKENGISMTEVVLRLIDHAQKQGVLKEWVSSTSGGIPGGSQPQEGSTAG